MDKRIRNLDQFLAKKGLSSGVTESIKSMIGTNEGPDDIISRTNMLDKKKSSVNVKLKNVGGNEIKTSEVRYHSNLKNTSEDAKSRILEDIKSNQKVISELKTQKQRLESEVKDKLKTTRA